MVDPGFFTTQDENDKDPHGFEDDNDETSIGFKEWMRFGDSILYHNKMEVNNDHVVNTALEIPL